MLLYINVEDASVGRQQGAVDNAAQCKNPALLPKINITGAIRNEQSSRGRVVSNGRGRTCRKTIEAGNRSAALLLGIEQK